jgi:hypothetical protein
MPQTIVLAVQNRQSIEATAAALRRKLLKGKSSTLDFIPEKFCSVAVR